MDNTTATALLEYQLEEEKRRLRKKRKKKRKERQKRRESQNQGDDSASSSSNSSKDRHLWVQRRAQMLEEERVKLIKQWRSEARAEEEAIKREQEYNQWHRRVGRYMREEFGDTMSIAFKFFVWLEAFIANLPLTIGAIALAIANLGVVVR